MFIGARSPLANGKSRHVGFKGVQPLQRVNQSNMLAVLTVMSDLETSLIRGKMGCDDDDETLRGRAFVIYISWLYNWLMLISNNLKDTN